MFVIGVVVAFLAVAVAVVDGQQWYGTECSFTIAIDGNRYLWDLNPLRKTYDPNGVNIGYTANDTNGYYYDMNICGGAIGQVCQNSNHDWGFTTAYQIGLQQAPCVALGNLGFNGSNPWIECSDPEDPDSCNLVGIVVGWGGGEPCEGGPNNARIHQFWIRCEPNAPPIPVDNYLGEVFEGNPTNPTVPNSCYYNVFFPSSLGCPRSLAESDSTLFLF